MGQYTVLSWENYLKSAPKSLKWMKQLLIAYMVLWNTKNAGKLFWNINEIITMLFTWKCNHLWHVFKISFLCSIKLVKKRKTAWVWADISNFQWLTLLSKRQLLYLRYYIPEPCITSENNLSQMIWDLVLVYSYFSSTTQQTCALELEMKINLCPTEQTFFQNVSTKKHGVQKILFRMSISQKGTG